MRLARDCTVVSRKMTGKQAVVNTDRGAQRNYSLYAREATTWLNLQEPARGPWHLAQNGQDGKRKSLGWWCRVFQTDHQSRGRQKTRDYCKPPSRLFFLHDSGFHEGKGGWK